MVATSHAAIGDRSDAQPATYRTLSVSRSTGPLVRLELQRSDEDGAGLHLSMIIDIDVCELQASIDAIVDPAEALYRFDDCSLSTGPRVLTRSGREIHLRPKVYQLLVYLLEHRCRAVSRDELCAVIWDGRFVGNATVDSTVKALRRAVGDNGIEQRVVQTISGYGYRFSAAVELTVRRSYKASHNEHEYSTQPVHRTGYLRADVQPGQAA